MVETAAHLNDHVFPRLPVRQWVLSVPKRLRYYMQRDGAVLNMVLRIFLRVIGQSLQSHSPGAAQVDKAALHIGAVAFIHRFGSSLNEHVHFHVCVVDGVFEELVGEGAAQPQAQATAPRVIFHPAIGIDAATVAPVQTTLQKRILRAFVVLATRALGGGARTVAAVNDARHLGRVRLAQPDVVIAPQVLGGELAARLMCGEEVTLDLVMQQVFQNPKPPQ